MSRDSSPFIESDDENDQVIILPHNSTLAPYDYEKLHDAFSGEIDYVELREKQGTNALIEHLASKALRTKTELLQEQYQDNLKLRIYIDCHTLANESATEPLINELLDLDTSKFLSLLHSQPIFPIHLTPLAFLARHHMGKIVLHALMGKIFKLCAEGTNYLLLTLCEELGPHLTTFNRNNELQDIISKHPSKLFYSHASSAKQLSRTLFKKLFVLERALLNEILILPAVEKYIAESEEVDIIDRLVCAFASNTFINTLLLTQEWTAVCSSATLKQKLNLWLTQQLLRLDSMRVESYATNLRELWNNLKDGDILEPRTKEIYQRKLALPIESATLTSAVAMNAPWPNNKPLFMTSVGDLFQQLMLLKHPEAFSVFTHPFAHGYKNPFSMKNPLHEALRELEAQFEEFLTAHSIELTALDGIEVRSCLALGENKKLRFPLPTADSLKAFIAAEHMNKHALRRFIVERLMHYEIIASPEDFICFTSFVDANDANQWVGAGKLFYDGGTGGMVQHGKFSHALQLLIIAITMEKSPFPKEHTRKHSWKQLLRWLVQLEGSGIGSNNLLSYWVLLLDSYDGSGNEDTVYGPGILYSYLLTSSEAQEYCPLLRNALTKSFYTRLHELTLRDHSELTDETIEASLALITIYYEVAYGNQILNDAEKDWKNKHAGSITEIGPSMFYKRLDELDADCGQRLSAT